MTALRPLSCLGLGLIAVCCQVAQLSNREAALMAAEKSNETKQSQRSSHAPAAKLETATFGEGCFWCSEAVFQRLRGVKSVVSGYSGGSVANPTYEQVCSGRTGHAEVVEITYDPSQVSFDQLLRVFWQTHDPTTLNQQGADMGTQYRSVIFFHNDEQRRIAEQYKKQLDMSGTFKSPIVTEVVPFKHFYPAEKYHQDYFNLNPANRYCQFVIRPKVEKFNKEFKDLLKGNPDKPHAAR
ncbi:MAG TPA: peptide-methionine (S)-S-oxide reductase MsrA [Lacipirellulaceae bacterium]|nr:peptide-methionine (S)-S-oxide reductase MsrA [Lacipirellulaceae bacterium]